MAVLHTKFHSLRLQNSLKKVGDFGSLTVRYHFFISRLGGVIVQQGTKSGVRWTFPHTRVNRLEQWIWSRIFLPERLLPFLREQENKTKSLSNASEELSSGRSACKIEEPRLEGKIADEHYLNVQNIVCVRFQTIAVQLPKTLDSF